MTINERFFDLLSKSGATYKQFSQATGIPEKTLNTWKYRGTTPPTDQIHCICNFFKVSYSYLLTGEEYVWDDPEIMDAVKSEYFDLFKQLHDESAKLDDQSIKMMFDIMVWLRHVILSKHLVGDLRADALSLLQTATTISTSFIDYCITISDPVIEATLITSNIECKKSEFTSALEKFKAAMFKE